jgi:hypothetical protein
MEWDKERLKQVLAGYGADPARWPEADRELAKNIGDASEAAEIDSYLNQASAPRIPAGAQTRLLARIEKHSLSGNVTVLRPRTDKQVWYSITALAASLALGIFIGTQEDFADVMPLGATTAMDDATGLAGLGEAEDALEGDLS